jgi:hypothetical protein
MECDVKKHRDLGEKIIEDEASYLKHGQEVLQKNYDPNEIDNGEFRGVKANIATKLYRGKWYSVCRKFVF